MDNKKGDISVALCSCAPPNVRESNQIIKDLEILSSLNHYLSKHYANKQLNQSK
jgi:hypothetical protein